jgi:serine/threonine protein kinase
MAFCDKIGTGIGRPVSNNHGIHRRSVNTAIVNPNPLPNGSKLADYVVTGILGEGGFGIVYSARDELLGRTIAIKEYLPSSIAGRTGDLSVRVRSANSVDMFSRGLQRFMGEAKLLAQCSHPALLEVYRVWEQNETAYIAMRLCHGQTAREARKIMNRGMPEADARQLLMPIFDAVMHLHSRNVIHRDISPDNIMILPSGVPTLLDMGAARTVLAGSSEVLTTLIKPGYAPIEQYDDDGLMQQGPWTDVYGLGSLMYFLLTGNAPKQSIYRAIRDSLDPIPVNEESGYSQHFADAIMRALAVQPEQRTRNVPALIADLGWTLQTTQLVLPLSTAVLSAVTEIKASAESPTLPAMLTPQPLPHDVVASTPAGEITQPSVAHTSVMRTDPEATVFWESSVSKHASSASPAAVQLSATIVESKSVTLLVKAGILPKPSKSPFTVAEKIPPNAKHNRSQWFTRIAAAAGILFVATATGFIFSGSDSSTANVAAPPHSGSLTVAPSVAASSAIVDQSASATAANMLAPANSTTSQLNTSVIVVPSAVTPPEPVMRTEKDSELAALLTRDPNADRTEEQQRFDRTQRELATAEAKTKTNDTLQPVTKGKAVTVNSLAALAQNAQREGKLQQARAYWAQLAALPTASPRSRAQALSSAATRLCAAGNIDSCEQLFVQAFRADASWRLASADADQALISQAYRAARAKAWGY